MLGFYLVFYEVSVNNVSTKCNTVFEKLTFIEIQCNPYSSSLANTLSKFWRCSWSSLPVIAISSNMTCMLGIPCNTSSIVRCINRVLYECLLSLIPLNSHAQIIVDKLVSNIISWIVVLLPILQKYHRVYSVIFVIFIKIKYFPF